MYKILICFITVFSFSALEASSQENTLANLKLWQAKGYAKYAEINNDYYSAILYYQYIVDKKKHDYKYKQKIANLQYLSRDYHKAHSSYSYLVNHHKKNKVFNQYHLALCSMSLQSYEEAISILKNIDLKKKKLIRYETLIENQLEGCYVAQKDIISSSPFLRLDDKINGAHIEFCPIILDDSTFVYGSNRLNEQMFYTKEDSIPLRRYYKAILKHDSWNYAGAASKPFNFYNQSDLGGGVFSKDKKRYYFTKTQSKWNGKIVTQLYMSEKKNNIWIEPIKLGNGINNNNYSTSEPAIGTCYNPNLEILYFISDRSGGFGGTDIWFSVYDTNKKTYQEPINAGVYINTVADECTPFYDIYSRQLFFSSKGHPGFGGFDIFSSKGEMVNWETIKNIGRPFNSSYDDLSYVQNALGSKGFFCSNRPGGKSLTHPSCCDDIFNWETNHTEKVWVKGKLTTNKYRLKDIMENNHLLSKLESKGISLDYAKMEVYLKASNNQRDYLGNIQTDSLGNYKVLLNKNTEYEFFIDDSRVLDKRININTDMNNLNNSAIDIKPIEVKTVNKKAAIIDNIYYQYNSSQLKSESKAIIDSTLLKLMLEFNDLIVEIISHTDSKGSSRFNKKLSLERAKNVVGYLVEKGIDLSRLKATGEGESTPIAPNELPDGTDNPKGRALNRRTEFRLIDKSDLDK